MNGITLIDKTYDYGQIFFSVLAIILLGSATIYIIITSIKDIINKSWCWPHMIMGIMLIFSIILTIITIPLPILIDYPIRYKVRIDDSVSLNEFNKYYEIKDHDGDIYTIVEKEND